MPKTPQEARNYSRSYSRALTALRREKHVDYNGFLGALEMGQPDLPASERKRRATSYVRDLYRERFEQLRTQIEADLDAAGDEEGVGAAIASILEAIATSPSSEPVAAPLSLHDRLPVFLIKRGVTMEQVLAKLDTEDLQDPDVRQELKDMIVASLMTATAMAEAGGLVVEDVLAEALPA